MEAYEELIALELWPVCPLPSYIYVSTPIHDHTRRALHLNFLQELVLRKLRLDFDGYASLSQYLFAAGVGLVRD